MKRPATTIRRFRLGALLALGLLFVIQPSTAEPGRKTAPVGSFRELLEPASIARLKPWRTHQESTGLIDSFEDYGNFLREEPAGHYVLMDVKGAGCLDRFWCV